MDGFEVPTIPKIFVPPIQLNTTESQVSSNVSINKNVIQKNESNSSSQQTPESEPKPKEADNGPPKLCQSCSQILLSYFVPLQQYVNEVVQMARGDKQLTVLPILQALNSVVPNQTVNYSSEQTRSQSIERNSNNETERNVNRFDNRSEETHRMIQNHSENQTNVNYVNQNQNYSQNHPNNRQNESYGHQNQYSNQNQNQYSNQNQNQYSNQNQNYGNESNTESNQWANNERNQNQNQNRVEEIELRNRSEGPQTQTQSNEPFVDTSSEQRQAHHLNENQTNTQINYNERTDVNTNNADQREDSNQFTQNNSSEPIQESITSEEKLMESNERSDQFYPQEDREYRSEGSGSGSGGEYPLPISSPFAFVTIAYNNLSATNAIILANSLIITNNKSMNYTEGNGNKSLIQIPFVILIGGQIDPSLKSAIYMVFDEVISEPMDVRVALLSDQTFGIQQYKLQLWKELQDYQKCLYLESSTLVVGKVTNLFEECEELSACVDWIFPDNFNCSVFVFEPSLTTYDQIISFAIFHQKCSAQKDEDMGDTLDEMTLLNQFFAPKWKRISFIYNFVKNDAIYTQIPAFMKYGDTIKIVNFGHMMSQTTGMGNRSSMVSVQPWHIPIDLLAAEHQELIKSMAIDNYSKFYLNCFIQRLWPIIQNPLTPLLVTKHGIGRREWSIFDLIRLLTNESGIETDDHMFTQTPITFRRIKSSAEKIAQIDALTAEESHKSDQNQNQLIHQDSDISENLQQLSLDESGLDLRDKEDEEQTVETEQTSEDSTQKAEATVGQTIEPPKQNDDISKREWEAGRIDWMGAHQSDKIIDRLKKLIQN